MTVKCIALGNRIMGDDSIGIKVAEEISPRLKEKNIALIFGETDIDYALSKIEDGDFLFIIDATYFNLQPGTVTFTSIHSAIEPYQQVYSQHQPSLIQLLKVYKKTIEGCIIGIEVGEIFFGLELSNMLIGKLPHVCDQVYEFIYQTIRGIYDA